MGLAPECVVMESFVTLCAPLATGLFELARQVVPAAGTLILLLMLVALGGIAYKGLVGDGIEWPDDTDDSGDSDGVRRTSGDEDEEWKKY
jgi:hypothetical protein